MEIEIISKEMVKPSSPTPHIYKLSLLDQANPPTFYPVILYFPPDQAHSDHVSTQKVHILKESLSLNLSRFYPFAGLHNDDDRVVDCKDGGVPFTLAKVRGNLQDFLSQPDLKMTMIFLPSEKSRHAAKPGDHVCEIQVNCFECGGLAIGILVSHIVADAATLSTFLQSWGASTARSNGEQILPEFIGENLFPPVDVMDSESKLFPPDFSKFLKLTKYVTRRYLFDASIIAKLKERALSSGRPTSVEVVSAFIWKCYMNVFADESDLEKPFILMQPVSLRRRADPALPDTSFGNFLWLTVANCTSPTDAHFKDLAYEVKRSLKKIDVGFVKALQSVDGYYEKLEETKQGFLGGSNFMGIASWCKFGWYDIDFGWGKPLWISLSVFTDSESVAANGATFMDTRSGDGIEAWMTLDEDFVKSFEENEDIQKHVLINPSPLQ